MTMTTIDRPATDQPALATPPADPPAGPATPPDPAPPPPRARAVLRVAIEVYTGKDHRHHLTVTDAAGEDLCQGWYGSRRAAMRAGREWAGANGYDLEEEG